MIESFSVEPLSFGVGQSPVDYKFRLEPKGDFEIGS
jgi:hypothetical protein